MIQALRNEGDATVPHYSYWPASSIASAWPPADSSHILPGTLVTEFADGGLLENTGLASLFAFEDIVSAFAFVNSATPISQSESSAGVDGYPNTNIIVDDAVSTLFGYMRYNSKDGYVPFSSATSSLDLQNRCAATAQIFPSSSFPELLQGLWAATGDGATGPAVFPQTIPLQNNALFNIKGGRTVNVWWYYLNASSTWQNQLAPDVAALMSGSGFDNFPHYDTIMDTELTVPQYNLLANLAAWMVTTTASEYMAKIMKSDPA
jgi:hypothetical protein